MDWHARTPHRTPADGCRPSFVVIGTDSLPTVTASTYTSRLPTPVVRLQSRKATINGTRICSPAQRLPAWWCRSTSACPHARLARSPHQGKGRRPITFIINHHHAIQERKRLAMPTTRSPSHPLQAGQAGAEDGDQPVGAVTCRANRSSAWPCK